MKKCVVIGGGFAGLTAAAYLSNAGHSVELIEASPKLGGRAYSFQDRSTGDVIDNGQHIMMGCYKETLKFLSMIGASGNIEIQKQLDVIFLKKNYQLFHLKASSAPYPFNLLSALLHFTALSRTNRLSILKFFLKIFLVHPDRLKSLSVKQWLQIELQNEETIKSFWEILTVGTLNTSTEKASAKIFSDVLKEIFFKGTKSASIILPLKGLSETYCGQAANYLSKNDGIISLSEKVESLIFDVEKVVAVKTDKRVVENFDFVVTAVPFYALKKLGVAEILPELNVNYSTIVSIHLWLDINPLEEKFYGLIDSMIHWIFNHGKHITLVISNADYLSIRDKKEILEIALMELEKFTSIKRQDVISSKIIKEKRATFVPSNDLINKRPSSKTKIKNLFLAGDWTDTGLPSTIESAVKSGRTAAELIIDACKASEFES